MVNTERPAMETNKNSGQIAAGDIKLRAINCELNPLSRSDGSALFAQGKTCVLASMLGPAEVQSKHLNIEKAYVECIFRPKAGIPTIQDKLREAIIKDTCESAILTALHPRTMISIQVQELDNRCGLEACAINAACMALLVGGAPMKYTIAAVHCILDKDDKFVLDPDHCQSIGSRASFLFVFDSLEKGLVTIHNTGRFSVAQFNDAELLCRTASEIIFKFYRKILAQFYNKSLLPGSAAEEETPEPVTASIKDTPMEV